MLLDRILDFSHSLIKKAVQDGDFVIDGTCGNGHDTAFMAELVGESGHVYAFDIQEEAIQNTENRLKEKKLHDRVTLIHGTHGPVHEHLRSEHKNQIQAAIYNLGYLPGSDKSVITTPDETITSVKNVLSSLKKGGLIVLVVYHGHSGGREEKDALLEYVSSLDHKSYHVLNYGFINQKRTPPFILAIEKH
ncbi:class I SAM-dependent methyltransferase [Halobacillus litoralis]|uniref:class I SAM-dependent methyltransferase n=1 Tax=Halobacillus litoralis TaxID=45668 RepID=UPI001CFD1D09|nr:class I SAM-dependent methyltransferase [Halobacillus litoralis]